MQNPGKMLAASIVSFAFFIIHIKGVTSQYISIPPKNVNSTIGETVTFDCTIGNRTNAPLSWQKLGTPATILYTSAVKVYRISGETRETQKFKILLSENKDGSVTYTLIVNNVQKEDNGTYMCMILRGERQTAVANLLVLLPPKFLPGLPRMIKSVEGDNSTLFCNVSGTPTPRVTWSRSDGRPVPHGKSYLNGAKYYIDSVTRNDSGTYICQAENGVPPNPIRIDVKMEVSFPAKVRAIKDEVGQQPNKGYEAHLLCVTTGFPRPGTRWYRVLDDGSEKEVVADFVKYSRQSIAGVEKYSHDLQVQLTIHKVVHDDFGNYTCRVSNSYGVDHAYILFYRSDAHIESKALSDPDSSVNKKDTRYVMDDSPGNGSDVISNSIVLTLMLFFLVQIT